MNKVYDLIIIGAGPAGITAAVYATRKQLDFIIITGDIGGQAAWSSDIENYTGFQFITGPELVLKFSQHIEAAGVQVNLAEYAKKITKKGNQIEVISNETTYQAKTLIIASGKRPRPLNVVGEKEFKNKGLTYCATCDGPLFKGKAVAVIGGGNSAMDAGLQMAKICPRVYIVNAASELTGDKVMIQKVLDSSNINVYNKASVKRIYGDAFVKGVEIGEGKNQKNLDVEGVFVEIGLIPNSEFAANLKRNKSEEIIVDCYNRTNIEGIFAAGDVTSVLEKQIIIACGEGAKAALSAFHYLLTEKW